MNTLSKQITAALTGGEEGYNTVVRDWKRVVAEGKIKLRPEHYLLYAILRGKDYRKAFTPVTNKTKLENGCREQQGLFIARQHIHLSAPKSNPYNELSLGIMRLLEPFESLGADSLRVISSILPPMPQSDAYVESDALHNLLAWHEKCDFQAVAA